MDSKMDQIVWFCIVCKKQAQFLCQRCRTDAYCSPQCQRMNWPMHRIICFPMPPLISITNMMLSLNDTQDRALPAIQYNKTNNNSAIKGCFFNNTSPKSSPNDFRSKTDKIFSQMENGNRKFCNNNKSNKWKPREFYSGSETRSEYIGTSGARAAKLESDRVLDTTRRAEYTGTSKAEAPKLESDRVLDTTRSMETKLHKWKKPFPLDDTVTDVIVLHFIESPTTTCWVMQQKHANERSQLIKDINHLHQHIDVIDKDAITINEIFCVLFEGIHHRGLVIYRINSQEVLVRLIDNGHSFPIRISAIKPLHQTARDVNAFAFEINFQTSHAVAIDQILQISKISAEADGVINVRLEEEKTFIQDDLELEPLPVNVPMELFCLDYSKIDMGYISACETDAAKIKSINVLSDQISEYCRLKNDQKYYRPRLEELCLAYLDDDQQWYRAQCIQEENSNLFMLVFIDYGNICEVHSHNIRKMVKQFMQPSIMHMCCINGIPKRPSTLLATNIISYFNAKPIFSISRSENDGDVQIIYVPDLLKAIHPYI